MSSSSLQNDGGEGKKDDTLAKEPESPLAVEETVQKEEKMNEEEAEGEERAKEDETPKEKENGKEEEAARDEEKPNEENASEPRESTDQGSALESKEKGTSQEAPEGSDSVPAFCVEKPVSTPSQSTTLEAKTEAPAGGMQAERPSCADTKGTSAETCAETSEKSHVEGRLAHARAKSCTLNRASSKQRFFPMEAWFRIYPLLDMEDLGPGFSSDVFVNAQGLKIATYAWRQCNKPTGAAVLFHSYTSYALFDFLRHQPEGGLGENQKEDATWVPKFKDSFVELFYNMGMNVYALDHQSHGRSDGWREWRCNVAKFDFLIDDAIQFLREKVEGDSALPKDAPLVVLGYSMGGNVAIQCIDRVLRVDALASIKRRLSHAVLLAPLIQIKLDRKTEVLAKFNKFCLASCMPNLRFSRASSGECKFLDRWYENDALAYSGRTKSRMVASLYEASLKTGKILKRFPPELKLLCLQGTADDTVDFRAPLKLYESPVKLDMFYLCGWDHYLPKDPRVDKLLGVVRAWVEKAVLGETEATHYAHFRALSLQPPRQLPATTEDSPDSAQ